MCKGAGCKLVTEFFLLQNSSVVDVHLPDTGAENGQLALRIQYIESTAEHLVAELGWIAGL